MKVAQPLQSSDGQNARRVRPCSTDQQDLTAQRDALGALGVKPNRIYVDYADDPVMPTSVVEPLAGRVIVDHGLTGTNRARPGLREALAACRSGDTLMVTKLDRLARSLTDARNIADELTRREVKLNIGGSVHDPTDPVGRLLFNVLAMVAEFSNPTSSGCAPGKGRSPRPKAACGRQPKLSAKQEAHLVALYRAGEYTFSELEELFPVTRSTIYRAVARAGGRTAPAPAGDTAT